MTCLMIKTHKKFDVNSAICRIFAPMMRVVGNISVFLMTTICMPSCSLFSGTHVLSQDYKDNSEIVATNQEAEETANESRRPSKDIHLGKVNRDRSGLEIPASMGQGEQILYRTGYTTSYNREYKLPNWTAWHLTASHTNGPYKRKGVTYTEDKEVGYPRATNADYRQSGYDRGHMCPSGDNKWSHQAQEDCFLFTNMCPQSHNLNGGDWNDLEMLCRRWAERYGDIYIVCGPLVDKTYRTIGRNKVAVPYAFFKVVLCMRGMPKAIGFVYENEDGHRPMTDYVLTVDEVERLTGIDFFPQLPDDVENRVEAMADLAEWGK